MLRDYRDFSLFLLGLIAASAFIGGSLWLLWAVVLLIIPWKWCAGEVSKDLTAFAEWWTDVHTRKLENEVLSFSTREEKGFERRVPS